MKPDRAWQEYHDAVRALTVLPQGAQKLARRHGESEKAADAAAQARLQQAERDAAELTVAADEAVARMRTSLEQAGIDAPADSAGPAEAADPRGCARELRSAEQTLKTALLAHASAVRVRSRQMEQQRAAQALQEQREREAAQRRRERLRLLLILTACATAALVALLMLL